MSDIDAQLAEEVIKKIDAFDTLSQKGVSVTIDRTPEGQFRIVVESQDTKVEIRHSWGNPKFSFATPGTIDLRFTLPGKVQNSYVTLMSECELELFPQLLDNAYRLTMAFLAREFTSDVRKTLWLHRERLVFNLDALYRVATRV